MISCVEKEEVLGWTPLSVYLHTNIGLPAEYRLHIYPYIEGVVVVSINHRDTYISKETVLEPILRNDSISGITFIAIMRQHTISNECLTSYKNRYE